MKKIELTVLPDKEIKKQGDLFGIFFEDLNHAADGGLYGEMVRNRSFEFDAIDQEGYSGLTAWEKVERGDSVVCLHIETHQPLNGQNLHYLRVEVLTSGEGGGVRNQGYNTGIPAEKGKQYRFSCYYRRKSRPQSPVQVQLEDKDGQTVYASASWNPKRTDWTAFSCVLTAEGTDFAARLAVIMESPMVIDFDMVSLFPVDTFMSRENGLRKDIAEMLRDMHPAFMRFPGGCLTHIGSLDAEDRNSIYRWKKTVGPVEKRPARRNTWNYNQSLGLGYFEYFQFCEDIGAKPLPVIAAGYDPHFLRAVPMDSMQEWIDEALDLIEFANGSTDTAWGAVRAEMGHAESFELKYLGIGNEEVGGEFFERYKVMVKAIKAKYPEIQVIGSAGPGSAGSEFTRGWKIAQETETSFVDEHFYQCPEWFIANADRYARYSADGPKAFLGEYASGGDTWYNALAEAAFMIGMEKAPGVGLACYAPMLCNVDYQNWHPNLLSFNNHEVYGSPSYYVQKLFMNYTGESLVEASVREISHQDGKVPELTGVISMHTKNAEVEICNVVVRNNDTGEEIQIPGFVLSPQHTEQTLGDVSWKNYSVLFTFCKKIGGTAEDLNGQYGFHLDFAKQDEENKLFWTIDGWQRLTSLNGMVRGKRYGMGLYLCKTERNKIYSCELKVEGAHVKTSIDGTFYCEHRCRAAVPQELYYSAVRDRNKHVIVKLVNLMQERKEICIQIPGMDSAQVEITSLSGHQLTDQNSFAEPQKVAPVTEKRTLSSEWLQYQLLGYSFCIIRF